MSALINMVPWQYDARSYQCWATNAVGKITQPAPACYHAKTENLKRGKSPLKTNISVLPR